MSLRSTEERQVLKVVLAERNIFADEGLFGHSACHGITILHTPEAALRRPA
jgi:hypothetical protein